MRRLSCLFVCLLSLNAAVLAENLRLFPQDSKRATFNGFVNGGVKLGRQTLAAAPGLQIRDQANLIVLSGRLDGVEDIPVRVQFDTTGAVWRIWILTPEEAAKKN